MRYSPSPSSLSLFLFKLQYFLRQQLYETVHFWFLQGRERGEGGEGKKNEEERREEGGAGKFFLNLFSGYQRRT
jgi:hypothetical protein